MGRAIHLRRWKVTVVLGAVGVFAAVLVGLATLTRGNAAQSTPAKLWPPFSILYMYERFDADTGKPTVNEVHKLTAKSEYDWRDETISDALVPARAGSYRLFQGGTLTSYDAQIDSKQTIPIGKDTVTSPNPFLDPSLLPRARDGRAGPGWSVASPVGDTVSAQREDNVACGSASSGPRQCEEMTYIQWRLPDARSNVLGGIPTDASRTVGGKLAERFTSTSLTVQ